MKLTLEQIQQEAAENNWKVLSTSYTNLTTEMQFECPEGHLVCSPYRKIRGKFKCPVCEANPLKKMEMVPLPKTKLKRVLALDQATHTTGWSIWDGDNLMRFGTFDSTQTKDTVARLVEIRQWVLSLLDNYKPDLVILEDIQLQTSVNRKQLESAQMGVTVFKTLAELLGVLSVTLQEQNIPFQVVPSGVWRAKAGVKGRTRADKKRSAQRIVKEEFDVNVTEDEADAICLGFYGATVYKPTDPVKWE